jgi:arylsulfatase
MFRREAADGGSRRVRRRLRKNPYPNGDFLYINLMDAHAPYHHPSGDDFLNPLIGDAFANQIQNPEPIIAGYKWTVGLLSNVYRDIFDQLQDSYDYIITVSDHGEMLGEHGMWNHGYGLYPELTHIPLVISGDGINGKCDEVVSLLDIHRTILSLAEVEGGGRGQDLLDSPQPRRVLTQYHGFTPEHQEQFDAKGVSSSVFSEKDSPLSGVADPDIGYCFETHDHGIVGSSDGKAEMAISELRADLNCRVE